MVLHEECPLPVGPHLQVTFDIDPKIQEINRDINWLWDYINNLFFDKGEKWKQWQDAKKIQIVIKKSFS